MIRIFRHYVSGAYLGLFFVEFAVLFFAMYLGTDLRFLYSSSWYSDEYIILCSFIFAIVTTISSTGIGLYRRNLNWDDYHLLKRIGVSYTCSLLVLLVIYYTFQEFTVARSILYHTFILAFIGMLFCRYLFYKYQNIYDLKRKVLVIGAGVNARKIVNSKTSNNYVHSNYEIAASLSLNDNNITVTHNNEISEFETIYSVVEEFNIDEIVLALDDKRSNLPMDDLLDCKVHGVDIIDLMTFYEREQSMVDLENVYASWFIFSDGFANGGWKVSGKRTVDIFASLFLFLVSWPFMILVATAIFIDSGFKGPIFYRQKRVGWLDKEFDVLKFRSMRTDAESAGAQWAQENDNRVTRVGAIIRKTRLDELPQIWNVLKGNMSFVGPRPERPEFVNEFEKSIPYYRKRHRVKPGITGWAQLCYPYGANEYDAIQKLQYDLYYVKNYSLFLDVTIIIHTIEVILWGKGAR